VPVSAIDFDPGASEVNQLNRLKLLMASVKKGPRRVEKAPGLVAAEPDASAQGETA
jgi:predicted nucleotide-binding protein (sugar kinase/HSP70/actin superfamily)